MSIDLSHRTANFAIGIGEKECRGKGYGTEATILGKVTAVLRRV